MSQVRLYEHTQIGWIVLAASLLPALALVPLAFVPGASALVITVLILVVLTAALFGSLTVRVDENYVSWRFGIGLLRHKLDLGLVHAFGMVENPWYYGWGIRWYPGGKLYNVSGNAAVELVLRDGGRVRVGTDEPQALCEALRARLGDPLPLDSLPSLARKNRRKALILVLLVVATLVGGLVALMSVQARPAEVTVTADAVRIQSLFYGTTLVAGELRRIELVTQLPRIRMRTNGYTNAGTLRGWFHLDQLGKGRLFVEMSSPPFVLIHLDDGFVAVNFSDPSRTLQLFGDLGRSFPGMTALAPRDAIR